MTNKIQPLHRNRFGHGMKSGEEEARLKEARLSRNCHQILHYLKEQKGLHSAHDIYMGLRALSSEAPGLTTVYRSLETLVKSAFIQEVVLGDSEKVFEFIEKGQHHHHVICTSCRASVHLNSCFIEQWENRIEHVHGFEVRSHILELFGICPNCQEPKARTLN